MLKKAMLAVIAFAIVSVLFSGCFLMRTLTYTKDKVEPGEKSTAKVTVNGETGDMKLKFAPTADKRGSDGEFPFFSLIAEDDGTKLTNGGEFDTGGVFSGPKALKTDPVLAQVAGENCDFPIFKAKQGPPSGEPTAIVTNHPFDASNSRKIIDVKFPVKTDPDAIGGVAFALTLGTWSDDGDEIPEDPDDSDDDYECQPPYISTLILKGGQALP